MNGRLLITCPDRHGIVAAVSGFIADSGATSSPPTSTRPTPRAASSSCGWSSTLEQGDLGALGRAFAQEVAERLDMDWRLTDADRPKRMAVLVSKEDHCLVDLLWRHRRGELDAEIPLVVSNHPDHGADVEGFGIPYHHVPYPNEPELLELLRGTRPGGARPLHADPVRRLPRALGVPMINIHHSFLPAFAGANPYQRASERGVKIIGATAHYVTEELDAGPDHRAGRRARRHREHAETWSGSAATSSDACSREP